MRQGEHQMEIRDWQDLALACGDPGLLGAHLAGRAMAVAGGVMNDMRPPAAHAGLDVASQRRRAASHDGSPDPGRTTRQGVIVEIG